MSQHQPSSGLKLSRVLPSPLSRSRGPCLMWLLRLYPRPWSLPSTAGWLSWLFARYQASLRLFKFHCEYEAFKDLTLAWTRLMQILAVLYQSVDSNQQARGLGIMLFFMLTFTFIKQILICYCHNHPLLCILGCEPWLWIRRRWSPCSGHDAPHLSLMSPHVSLVCGSESEARPLEAFSDNQHPPYHPLSPTITCVFFVILSLLWF